MALTGQEMRPCWPQKVAVCTFVAHSFLPRLALVYKGQYGPLVHRRYYFCIILSIIPFFQSEKNRLPEKSLSLLRALLPKTCCFSCSFIRPPAERSPPAAIALFLQNFHKLFPGDSLLLIQIPGQFIQLFAVGSGAFAYSASISGVTPALFSSLTVWAAFSQKAALRRWRL